MTTKIPSPPGLPIIGNLRDIDQNASVYSFMEIAKKYGEIYELRFPGGKRRIFVNTVDIFDEVCDETRFAKVIHGALYELRAGVGSGLFTAYVDEPKWHIAHRILMPIFAPESTMAMFDDMYDISSQLILKWARYGPLAEINVSEDFTRLALDSLALCTMDYRLNSFYTPEMHPFVGAMLNFMLESGRRAFRPPFITKLMRKTNAKFDVDVKLMVDIAREVMEHRRKAPTEKKDILAAMLSGKDPVTGEGMDDESIVNNLITFMIAGHETSGGLLSFVFYHLLKDKTAYRTAQKEVDTVVGKGKLKPEHLEKLPFVTAVLRETLRLHPTATLYSVGVRKEQKGFKQTLGDGKYLLDPDVPIIVNLSSIMRDPRYYGNDADKFRPERMLGESFENLPRSAFKPFGNGMRSCIGRPFAWQEAQMTLAMLLQVFDFSHDQRYQLKVLQTLTIKPDGFKMQAQLRRWVGGVDRLPKVLAGCGREDVRG